MTAAALDVLLDRVVAFDIDMRRAERRECETIRPAAADTYERARLEARTAATPELRTVARLEMMRLRKGAK